jgi:uncharacterized cupredoxin-like copper-binding protein
MKQPFQAGLAVIAALFVVSPAWADAGHAGHGQPSFSTGEPGNPKKPARVIQVTMGEKDGKMIYVPARIEVKKGEQIRFVLRNNGELEHEFVLGTTAENLKHAEAMKKDPAMEHGHANEKHLDPKKSGDFFWKFTQAGEFEYACLIPGHREAGMVGTIVVK